MRRPAEMIIPITGVIISGESSSPGPLPLLPSAGGGITRSDEIVKYIQQVEKNRRIKAFIFKIDSPGGTPYASKEIADSIKKVKKPTVAQIREHGTSGAYWVASDLAGVNLHSIRIKDSTQRPGLMLRILKRLF
jgi:ClpP class serine protease